MDDHHDFEPDDGPVLRPHCLACREIGIPIRDEWGFPTGEYRHKSDADAM